MVTCIIKIGMAHKMMVICKMKHNYLRKVFDGIVKIWVDAKKSNLFFKKLGRWLNFTKDIVKRKLQW